jgi:hypothetical protein
MSLRGFLLDSARCLENRAYYRQFIPFAAARGINALLWHFSDDQGCTLAFESVPGIGSPHAYTKAEMRELVGFAREHGITLIPELAALGHTRYITRLPQYHHLDEIEHVFTGMCPVAPETRDVLVRLIDETAEVFDSPWLHVGLDEANIGHHPLTRRALESSTRAAIIADHISFLHARVRRHGRAMMMWGDALLADRAVAPRISREIVICDWQYDAIVAGESTRYFLDEGFNVVLCPALICHDQTLFPGDQLALPNLRSTLRHRGMTGSRGARVVGVIETVWQPERYMHDALWMGLDLAAAMLRDGPDVSIAETAARFAREFYGFTAPPAWVNACRALYRLAPRRGEWLALLKTTGAELPDASTAADRARAWRGIAGAVAASEDRAIAHRDAYATFRLMIELVAHLYEKAAMLHAPSVDPRDVRRLLVREERFVARVGAVWDRERFADDPSKYVAARACFRDNNLHAVLHASAGAAAAASAAPDATDPASSLALRPA